MCFSLVCVCVYDCSHVTCWLSEGHRKAVSHSQSGTSLIISVAIYSTFKRCADCREEALRWNTSGRNSIPPKSDPSWDHLWISEGNSPKLRSSQADFIQYLISSSEWSVSGLCLEYWQPAPSFFRKEVIHAVEKWSYFRSINRRIFSPPADYPRHVRRAVWPAFAYLSNYCFLVIVYVMQVPQYEWIWET